MKTRLRFIMFLLTVFLVQHTMAQERVITGTITSKTDNSDLPGVNVVVKGTTIGTVTDINGKYKINVPEDGTTLVFSSIGYLFQEVEIGSRSVINIVLAEDVTELGEVVVTAIGIEREKRSLGYAVQQVDADELKKSQQTNFIDALNSKVAGVSVTRNSGTPGSASTIRIRGNTSISGNNSPLFVIDGVPIDNTVTGGAGAGDGGTAGVANTNRAVDVNPSDIESLTVLKGASATALYGLRAANGAVIIKTKRGSVNQKPRIIFSTTVSADRINQITPLQDKFSQGSAGTYALPSTAFFPSGVSWGDRIDNLVWVPSEENKWDKNGNVRTRADAEARGLSYIPMTPYDNVGDFYETGYTTDNYLSIGGGGDKATYFVSIGHHNSKGVVPNAAFERITGKVNADMRFTDKFKASMGVTFNASNGQRIQQGSNISGVNLGLFRTPPSFDNSNGFGGDAEDELLSYEFLDGSQRSYRAGGGYDNPFWVVNNSPHFDEVNRMIGYLQFDYAFTDWLDLTYRVGNDFYNDRRSQGFNIGSRTNPAGQVWERQIFNNDLNSDIILTVNRDINEDLTFKGIIGHNFYRFYNQSIYTQGDGLTIPKFYNISNASAVFSQDNEQEIKRHGLFFDVGFGYKNFLFLNITGRNDFSSTLPNDNNSFFYPSFNGSFVFSELIGSNVLTFGKIRATYAVVGNDAPFASTDSYFQSASSDGTTNQIADGWTTGIGFPFSGTPGFTQQNTLGNSSIKPEKSTSYEFGADLRFFNDRLGIDVSYFSNTIKDQILPVSISAATGFRSTVQNAGEISSKGIEVVLTATPVKLSDFSWDASINFTQMENKVESLAPGIDNIFLGGFTGTGSFVQEGQPYGVIRGGQWLRDPDGNIVIGPNGFPLGGGTGAIGDPNPDWTAGVYNSFTYKGINLSFLFDFRQGGEMWNGTKGALTFFGMTKLTENRGTTTIFDGVVDNGDGTYSPNTTQVTLDQNWYTGDGGGFGNVDEHFIESTSWIRLRDISLSYSLPKSILENTFIKDINIALSGRNLWLSTEFDGTDPETSLTGGAGNAFSRNAIGLDYFNMPNTKSYSASLRFTF